jgi:signal transduction histidine kinase
VTAITDASTQIYADPQDYAALVAQLLEHGSAESFECRLRRADGRLIWVLQNVRLVREPDGRPMYFEGIVEDITARKHAEAERAQLERERDQFFSSISHDLRTPLAAITASVGVVLANEPKGTPRVLHRLLVNIDESADDMAMLVEDLLELTRLQAGRVELDLEAVDLYEVGLRAAREIEPLAQARGQQVQLELPVDGLTGVVDAQRLGRVLLNLLGNAAKYGREQGTIRIRLEQRGDHAVFSVADDGPGIPPAEHEHIFERFHRANTDETRKATGSGLGLAIARGLVELHGGRIWVESALNQGATFHVALPLGLADRKDGGR